MVDARAEFLRRPVEISDDCLASHKACQAINRGAESGKPFGFVPSAPVRRRNCSAQLRFRACAAPLKEDWELVHRYVSLHERVISFVVRWNGFAETLSVPRLNGGVANLRQIELTAIAARKAHDLAMSFDARLPSQAQKVFAQPPLKLLVGGPVQLREVREQLVSHLSRAELSSAATQFSTLQEKLAGKSGPVTDALAPVPGVGAR